MIGIKRETPQSLVRENVLRENVHGYALTTIAAGVLIGILYWARVVFINTIFSDNSGADTGTFRGDSVRLRFPRSIATLMVGAIAALGLYFAGLAAYNQLSGIARDVPEFRQNLSGFITGAADRIQNLENATSRLLIPARKTEQVPTPPAPARPARKNRKPLPAPAVEATVPGRRFQPPAPRAPSPRCGSMKTETRSPTTSMPVSARFMSCC